jgi:predicted NUDIX family NTP pyrophosphohydrolase
MKKSAGILPYRKRNNVLEVFLVHMGGPFWKNKVKGAWTIVKGEIDEGEDPFDAAKREFYEETGIKITGTFIPLNSIKQKGGKEIYSWAIEYDIDPSKIKSNFFKLEWPPNSGKINEYPEIDKADWFTVLDAKAKIIQGQILLLEQLQLHLELI